MLLVRVRVVRVEVAQVLVVRMDTLQNSSGEKRQEAPSALRAL